MELIELRGYNGTGIVQCLREASAELVDEIFSNSKYNKTFWDTGRETPYDKMLAAWVGHEFIGGFVLQNNKDYTDYIGMHLALDVKYIKHFKAFCELCARWIELTGHIPFTEVNNAFPNSQKFLERRLGLTPQQTDNSRVYLRPPGWKPTEFYIIQAEFERKEKCS